ncbi:MAG: hypothetical protein HYX67_09805 [Candidatus Melainabacteria bacterium]|nr:hypothetical protein [Candidatus Melainabacteria bacterium]
MRLGIWAVVNFTIYSAFCLYYTSSWVDAKYVNHHISNLIVTIPGVVLLLYSYWRGYLVVRDNPKVSERSIVFAGVVCALMAVCIPNFHSSDVFSYIDVGWLQAHYHVDPYVTTVDQIPDFHADPMLTGVWAWNPCPYGFAFAQLTKLVCNLGGGNLATTAILMKCINFAAYLLLGALMYFGAKRLRLSRPDLSLYLYLWSPFVLIQSLANAHNDVLMTLFVMAGMFCSFANLAMLAGPALVVSTQIKFLWLVSFPFVLLLVYRKFGLKDLIINIVGAAVLLGALAIPYAADFSHFRFDIMRQDLSFNGMSLPALVENIAHGIERLAYHSTSLPWFESGLNQFVAALKTTIFVLFAIFSLWLFGRAIRKGKNYCATDMVSDSLLLALLAVCVVSSKFHPWYILMFFPVALWLPENSELRRLTITLSCTQLFAITYLGHSGGINYILLTATPLVISLVRCLKRRGFNS